MKGDTQTTKMARASESTLIAKSQLQLFEQSHQESCIQDTHVLEVYPIAPLSNEGPIEFVVQRSDRYFLDLYNSCVKLAVKVTYNDGTETPAVPVTFTAPTESPIPVNNFAHTLFSSCVLEVEGTSISATNNNLYPYIAYIMNTLNLSSSAKRALITTPAMYVADFVSGTTITTTPSIVNVDQNMSLSHRSKLIQKSKTIHLYMKPFIDFLQQPKYLLNNTQIRLTMRRSSPEFALMCAVKPADKGFQIQIESATLELRRVSLDDKAAKSIEATLCRGVPATYNFPTMDGRHFEIGKGQHNYIATNVFSGAIPQRAFLFLLPSEAFLGSYLMNPLIFWHYNISQVNFMIDDVAVRAKPITTNFDATSTSGMNYLNGYKSLFEMMRTMYTNCEVDIDYREYARKFCLFGIDITADQSNDTPSKRGNFSIDIRFAKATPMALKGICIAEFNCSTLINKERNVQVSIL